MSVESIAGMLNVADDRLKKLERGLSKQADSTELVAASLSKITLLEDTLAKLANQIEELEAKLDSVREAAIELKTLEALAPEALRGRPSNLEREMGPSPVAQFY